MKHKLESRFRRNINNLRYADAAAATAAAKLLQSCLTPCDPVDGSPSGSSVHGILQARTMERVAISFSRGRREADKFFYWLSSYFFNF